MPIPDLIFLGFTGLLLVAALMVILARNPVQSALFLVLAFFASTGLWMLLEAEFLALLLILVYVGAVMTLFLFVVMTINPEATSRPRSYFYWPLGLIVMAVSAALILKVINQSILPIANTLSLTTSNTEQLGLLLYSTYAYPLVIAGILLLVAIIAAISLSWRIQRNRKVLDPVAQIRVQRQERIRIVKMAAVKATPAEQPGDVS